MNIAFFLTPKKDIIYETVKSTMKQVMDKMEKYKYMAIPIIDEKGRYVGTITQGDLLWKLKNTPSLNFDNLDKITLKEIPRQIYNKPVNIEANIEDLISLTAKQNFVPVIDDDHVFIGMIKRSEIINYYYKIAFKNE